MSNPKVRPVALVILDGWGLAQAGPGNAISAARTPYYDEICRRYPRAALAASGDRVGLSPGVAGNAEIGHINLGAGRAVETDALRIERALATGEFSENKVLNFALAEAAQRNAGVHLIGLLSDAGVHASPETLYELLRMAKRAGVGDAFVHAVLDGRDVRPRTADVYIEALEIKMAEIGVGRLATLCGRFFAMDSGENWERTARAYTMLVHAEGERAKEASAAVRNSFLRGISDEFIAPVVLENENGESVATVKADDLVIFFNHRADAMRQLTRSLVVPEVGELRSNARPRAKAVCMTEYDRSFGIPAAFEPKSANGVLGSVLAENCIPNYRIAESDRFPHVTRFFNAGGTGGPRYEHHITVVGSSSSLRDVEPEMDSFKVADKFLRTIESDAAGLFVVNFSACDIAADTGNFEKTVEAIQFVDTCLGGVLERLRELGGAAVVTSSHGNCEQITGTDAPARVSSSNSVPFHLVDDGSRGLKLRSGALEDVAPTILALMGIEKPDEMTGSDLRVF